MMAALTVQLVIATLFSQVSASLPKTSYFKMVDIWLIFCIGITFLVILFHALIDRIAHPPPPHNNNNNMPQQHHHHPLNPKTAPTPTPPTTTGTRAVVWQVQPYMGSKLDKKKNPLMETEGRTHRVVHVTKMTVPVVFLLFNIGYWGYIFSN
ncbi:hypothetical protein Pcinc_036931 [Petrolisthes cinctipes]|uniref:Neurotransmitter-gated ion-channel transmembrane domain-containing protein n=1 Tax=Petrolisthes cinctipes TaxID=88211 RepID=A0AAE1EPA6_PETCI|nr:hypothetical protein Pcinc_036931 [Petrolisthes cinctipes]